jgi:hypothetical protein
MSQFIASFDVSGWADEMTAKLAELKLLCEQGLYAMMDEDDDLKEVIESLDMEIEFVQAYIIHEV